MAHLSVTMDPGKGSTEHMFKRKGGHDVRVERRPSSKREGWHWGRSPMGPPAPSWGRRAEEDAAGVYIVRQRDGGRMFNGEEIASGAKRECDCDFRISR